jgi:hypothetical protein
VKRRHGLALCLLVQPCILTLTAAGCGDQAPTQLADGSSAPAMPVALQNVDGATIRTTVHVVPLDRVEPRSALARCLERIETDAAVEDVGLRIGVVAESVTVATASGRAFYACDGRSRRGTESTGWCGIAFGKVERGHLLDPRLDLIDCAAAGSDRKLAFAWVEPRRDARYLALQHPGYVEVYPVTSRLPVRVATTTGIDLEASRARFELSEHDARGRLVRAYELEASVAG